MGTFAFSSILPEEFRDDLERLLYFNPLQARARGAIVASVEKYGQPQIVARDHFLHLDVESLPGAQTIYALAEFEDGEQLAGVVVFGREADVLVVLYLAVDEPYSSTGREAEELLTLRMLTVVQQIARRINGVHAVVFREPAGSPCRLRLDRPPAPLSEEQTA